MGQVFFQKYNEFLPEPLARIQALMLTGGMGLSSTDPYLQGDALVWSYVTSTGDPIVACVTREDQKIKQMEFWSFVVDRNFRGKGLATYLLNHVMSTRPGYIFWLGVLFSNQFFESAVKAYVKAGFKLHRLSTHTLLHTLTTDVPFLEMLTSPGVPNTQLYATPTTIVYKTIKLPWSTLSKLSLLSHTFQNELAGAMILGQDNVYDNPLKLEDLTRWGDITSVRDVKNQKDVKNENETLFVGIPSRTPSMTNFANTVLFHTHADFYYNYYATVSELSADFPSVTDFLGVLDNNQPNMVVSTRGIFIYQVAPCLSVVMLKAASPDLREVIYDAVRKLIEDYNDKIRFTRDTPYMQLGNTTRTQMLRDYYTSLTISSLDILPDAANVLNNIINPDEPIFTIWIYTLPISKTGYLTFDTHFPTP